MKPIRRVIIALSLLMLFVTYQSTIAAFTHVHYVNGVLITHSHPFQGEHSHTKTELVVIDRLSSFQLLEADLYHDLHPMRTLLMVLQPRPVCAMAKNESQQVVSLRAPPIVFC